LKALRVVKPGVSTTVQDQGRAGLMRYGLPPSGAMDQLSYRIGNLLVGNQETSASLEIQVYGLRVEAMTTVTVAITGADLCPVLNGDPVGLWSGIEMQQGDVLDFKRRRTGLWAYLAIRGGFDFPELLGARSTFLRGKIGEEIREGDILAIQDDRSTEKPRNASLPESFVPDFHDDDPIRVILGPQEDCYTAEGIRTFLESEYKITPLSDRLAFRLEGSPIEVAKGPGIISEAIPRGSIQVPGNGQPIVLLRDAQVSGGYGKIASLITVDMDRLARRVPGTSVRFKEVSREEAVDLLSKNETQIKRIKEFLET
jgi:biotin-dependent carboxylase-like uncharacterized protein